MGVKDFFLYTSAFFIPTIICQRIGNNAFPGNGWFYGLAPRGFPYGPPFGPYGPPGPPAPYGPPGLGPYSSLFTGPFLSLCDLSASSGKGFLITSSSPMTPKGVKIQSDSMLIEGPLAVRGQLPFLGVVALEGPLSAIGQGAVSYGCGDGEIGILNELPPVPAASVYPSPDFGVGVGITGLGLNGGPRGCCVY